MKIESKPSRYQHAERIIRIVQVANLFIAAIAAIATFSVELWSFCRIESDEAIMAGLGFGLIYAAIILLMGSLIWALLWGVLAVFNMAKDTADNKAILLHLATKLSKE